MPRKNLNRPDPVAETDGMRSKGHPLRMAPSAIRPATGARPERFKQLIY